MYLVKWMRNRWFGRRCVMFFFLMSTHFLVTKQSNKLELTRMLRLLLSAFRVCELKQLKLGNGEREKKMSIYETKWEAVLLSLPHTLFSTMLRTLASYIYVPKFFALTFLYSSSAPIK